MLMIYLVNILVVIESRILEFCMAPRACIFIDCKHFNALGIFGMIRPWTVAGLTLDPHHQVIFFDL